MTLLSLIAALLLEQLRPIDVRSAVAEPFRRFATILESRFDDGRAANGVISWCIAVLVPVILALVVYQGLSLASPTLAFLMNVAVLYLTMGLRQYSHYFTDIHLALRMGELDRARDLLAEWRERPTRDAGPSEVARLAMEGALIHAHRDVFAVMLCFAILPGPTGPILYRLAAQLDKHWGRRTGPEGGEFGAFARRALRVIDWLPQRVTAAGFAIVGDFEDAVYCWRTQADRWSESSSGILLASGVGALGVRLGMPLSEGGGAVDRPELGTGDEADVDFMQSTIGLVWRTLVLFLSTFALIGVASWVGR